MKARYLIAGIAAVLVPALIVYTPAWAKELISVTLTGPGLEGEVEITDPESVGLFSRLVMAPFVTERPEGLADEFFVVSMAVGDGHKLVARDVYHYYPFRDGSPGYFYYADVVGGWSSAEGMWFPLPKASDLALREFLIGLGADGPLLDVWSEESSADTSPAPIQPRQLEFHKFSGIAVSPLVVSIAVILVIAIALASSRVGPTPDTP